jgi:hypothetical protein
MNPVFVSHADYQAFVLKQLQAHFGPGIVIINKDWPLVAKLWMTDFSPITTLLKDAYSDRCPEGKDPASMFRRYLIYLKRYPEKGSRQNPDPFDIRTFRFVRRCIGAYHGW